MTIQLTQEEVLMIKRNTAQAREFLYHVRKEFLDLQILRLKLQSELLPNGGNSRRGIYPIRGKFKSSAQTEFTPNGGNS